MSTEHHIITSAVTAHPTLKSMAALLAASPLKLRYAFKMGS